MELPERPPHKVEITKEMWIKGNVVLTLLLIGVLGLYMLGMYLNASYNRAILNIDRQELKSLKHLPEVNIHVDSSQKSEKEKEDEEDLIEVSPFEMPMKI